MIAGVDMTVGDLVFGRRTHGRDGDRKIQRLAGQRMFHVQADDLI
jgi:hypothetical protein